MPLNPKTLHREFSGVPGALGITLGLPVVLVFFELVTNGTYSVKGLQLDMSKVAAQLPQSWAEAAAVAFNGKCWAAYLAWFFTLAVVDIYAPGKDVEGVPLRDGTVLPYRINGRFMVLGLAVLLAARVWALPTHYVPELEFLHLHQMELTCVTIIFSFVLATAVYAASFVPLRKPNGKGTHERILSVNGNLGNAVYDWFIGRELNPRIGPWDIKLYCELRPGLLLLLLIDVACIHHQYHAMGRVSDSLVLVTLLQTLYIFDGVLNEEGCLTMIDVVTDGFGFMLAFGDLAWVPWLYSLQCRYLALPQNTVDLGWAKTLAIAALSGVGYYIFSSANQQKSDFKQGKLDHMHSISTPSGLRLLVDGWWGLAQHINYFGDWLIGWLWCLPTGTQTPLTYFYVVYFATLLVHRQVRDDAKCLAKYGAAWTKYTAAVPYKIVPYIY